MPIQRFDWTIADVVKATSLRYEFIRRALHAGELDGITRPLRTNEEAVSSWMETLKAQPATAAPDPPKQKGPRPYRKSGKASDQLFKHVDPSTFGKKGKTTAGKPVVHGSGLTWGRDAPCYFLEPLTRKANRWQNKKTLTEFSPQPLKPKGKNCGLQSRLSD